MFFMKCRQCGKEMDKSDAIQIKQRIYVCSCECKEAYDKAHKPQDNANKDRKMLLDYIKSISPDANFRIIGSQLANLMKENPDMTYSGIAYTIRYMNSIGLDVKKSPLGLVKYKYDEAYLYWKWQKEMKRNVAAWHPVENKEIVIKNKPEDIFN